MTKPDEHVFDLSGGHLALDFVNTVGGMRGVTPNEHLHGYPDLVAFGRQTGVLGEREAARLAEEARRAPALAEAALAGAIALRETLYRIFLDRAEGQPPKQADLDALNAALSRALPHRRVIGQGGTVALGWEDSAAFDSVLWPVIGAATDLLVEDDARIRICGMSETEECGWLFVDRTKAGTRRWCSMKDCGNRAKARRHHQKIKAGA
jgi:predicted RNA-binding Zn ribbon-like protein